MIRKFLKQNVLSPKGLNWVQHLVSRIGLLICSELLERFRVPTACCDWSKPGDYSKVLLYKETTASFEGLQPLFVLCYRILKVAVNSML